ncbi:MAG: large conductance mechanosensitive channel protein MscL [Clostridia bacterium]|nr:large conductance mechanosensitive channel protein MscL [Clostridia bacterium]
MSQGIKSNTGTRLKNIENAGKNIAKKTINDYKAFAIKGNIMDMAIGVVIGSAFTNIVNTLVSSVITPFLSVLTNRVDLSTLFISLTGGSFESMDAAKKAGAIIVNYGALLNSIINFFLVSFSLFIVFSYMNKLKKQNTKVEEEVAEETTKECQYCFSKIPIQATRCAFCTSDLKKSYKNKTNLNESDIVVE